MKLNCNACESMMTKGVIPSNKGKLFWIPDGVRQPLFIFSTPKEGITLSGFAGLGEGKVVSYYCSKCNTITIPVDESLQQ